MIKFNKEVQLEKCRLLESCNEIVIDRSHENVEDEQEEEEAALENLRENIDDLTGKSGIDETDLIFLKGLMDSPVMQRLVKVQDRLEDYPKLSKPVSLGNVALLKELVLRCNRSKLREARELGRLLSRPHVQALIDTHDQIGEGKGEYQELKIDQILPELNGMPGETFRMIGVRRKYDEPLGLTVEVDDVGNLMVARILGGGTIDKQGLLHVGDVILEVNGVVVYTPEDLQTEIARSKESVTLKIAPRELVVSEPIATHAAQVTKGSALDSKQKMLTCYMRALFQYDPQEDTLLPCKEIGLSFDRGDILQIVDQKDPNWWQAKKVGSDGPAGLIPSPELEERRKAFVVPEADYVHKIGICGARISKRKKKYLYQSKSSSDFDKAELILYEEVTKMPPFKRKTLVLIGTQGVGRRTLKNRLINSDPDKFAGVCPWTSRPARVLEESGQTYWFAERSEMEEEIKSHKFLEYGEFNGHLYGTHLDTIREVIKQGKMCILDCSPQSLKLLHNSTDFLPYVIFIAAPGMEQLKDLYDVSRSTGNLRASSRNLTFDRQSSIRYSSRRARTLESLASLYEEEDLKRTLEDSASMQRTYDKYIDIVLTNNDFDSTFRKIIEALEALATEHQWVPFSGKIKLSTFFTRIINKQSFFKNLKMSQNLIPSCSTSATRVSDQMNEESAEKLENLKNRSTQCGDPLIVDEENIVVLVKSFSPLPNDDHEILCNDKNEDDNVIDSETKVSFL
ncbi:hypothetical protein FQA39_LY02738 [Lamprigera yunnana]|nr:hypothetical protein FQA39_LY02738 [Lamprigera yunnana]